MLVGTGGDNMHPQPTCGILRRLCHPWLPIIISFINCGRRYYCCRSWVLQINGYNGVWTYDHDDGSQFVSDQYSFMIWGGCKNYLGNRCGPVFN